MSLESNIKNALTRIATEFKTLKTTVSGNNQGNLTGLATTDKTSLVAAINELNTLIGAGGMGDLLAANNLSDLANAATARTNLGVSSSAEVTAEISAAISSLIDTAPTTLDTLNELAAALGDDPNFASTINTALGNRVRVDTATQGLTALQQSNARANIGAVASADIGNPNADLTVHFEDGLSPV